jgi:hypothetical protein
MGFLDENVTTPPNRKPPVDRDKIAALPKMYNPKGLVDYIKDKREDLRGDTNLTADSLSATYRPDAVTLRMSRGNKRTMPPMLWSEDTAKAIAQAYPKPLPSSAGKEPELLVVPTALSNNYISYPPKDSTNNYRSRMWESMNLHPVYCKIGAQGLAGSLYRVDDVLEGVSYAGKVRADLGLEPVYGFHKEWSDAMVITKELVAAMNKYFDEQEAGN